MKKSVKPARFVKRTGGPDLSDLVAPHVPDAAATLIELAIRHPSRRQRDDAHRILVERDLWPGWLAYPFPVEGGGRVEVRIAYTHSDTRTGKERTYQAKRTIPLTRSTPSAARSGAR